MNAQPQNKEGITPEEYLEFEKNSETRHEYFDGEIFAMTGASPGHNLINTNIASELRNHFIAKGSACRIYQSDQRVKIESIDKFTYPDISVACEGRFADGSIPSLLNPVVIIEILSDSTELYDRGVKFQHYRLIPSLKEYILVSQHSCLVEKFVRSNGGKWVFSSYEGMDKTIIIEAVQCEIALSEVYRWVNFQADF
ncbi:MAG: Uma2 family endonuclease [Desulfamplus sp.]|nr:Uma2 family endonuclease [Desulfamplus sp.]